VGILALAGLFSPVRAHADTPTDGTAPTPSISTTTMDSTTGTTDPTTSATPDPTDPTVSNGPVVSDPAPSTSATTPSSPTTSAPAPSSPTTSKPAPTSTSTKATKPTTSSSGTSSGTVARPGSSTLTTASRATADLTQAVDNSGLNTASTADSVNSVANDAANAIQTAAQAASGIAGNSPTGTSAATSGSDPIGQVIKNATNGSGSPLTMALLLGAISLLPAILMMGTAFTRIVIVLGFTRSALGTQQVPPNQVVIGLSLFLTLFVMAPTFSAVNSSAIQPLMKHQITTTQAFEKGQVPIKQFMVKQVRERDLGLFVKLSHEPRPKNKDQLSLTTLVPAFVISELRTAFLIGFLIFIPFLVIDLVVSAALSSLGMMMLPPVLISLPFKLLLFVAADGWYLVVQSLVRSFHT
jgi:flagellar biosynthetic protein FliP